MSDYTKYYKSFRKSGKRIYQQNFPNRLTPEFKKFNIQLIESGLVNSIYRKDETKDQYAYNPTTKQAVRLVRNKDGTFKYRYMKDYKLLNNESIIYKPDEKIYEKESAEGFLSDAKEAVRESGALNGGGYRMILYVNGEQILDISNLDFMSGWFNSPERYVFYRDETSGIENLLWRAGDFLKFLFTKYRKLSPRFVEQFYALGIKNCFIEPIRSDMIDRYENSESNSYKKKLEGHITYLDEIRDYYSDGIPIKEIEKVCEKLKLTVSINSPFLNNPYYEYITKNSNYNYKFYNTRLHHLDLSKTLDLDSLYNSSNYEEVGFDELQDIYKFCCKKDKKFIYKKNKRGITQINTEDLIYCVKDPFNEYYNDWLIETNLKWDDTDCLKNSELQSFLDFGTHYLLTHDFIDTKKMDMDDIEHIDRHKAYFTYHKNKYYTGLLTKITDFRKVDNMDKVGFYYIDNVDLEDAIPQFKRLNKELRILFSKNIYTSQLLHYFKDLGAKFDIKYGAYGIEHDIRFTDKFKEKDDIGISGYAKATGIFSSVKKHNLLYSNLSLEHAEKIRQETDNIYYDNYNKTAMFKIEKQQVRNRKYITGQIVGFLLIDMIEQLLIMDFKKLIRICVDGIYYYKHDYDNRRDILTEQNELWREKKDMTFKNEIDTDNTYIMNVCEKKVNYLYLPKKNKERKWYKNELHKGAGGTGKTYYNLMDKGLVDLVYVAPSYKLCSAVYNAYGAETTTFYHLFNEPYSKTQGYLYKWSNYIIDECSMLTEQAKQFLIKNIRGKVIFLGDIKYQLPPIVKQGEKIIEMNEKGFDNVINYTNVRRFKCDKLKKLAKKIRWCIDKQKSINFKKCGIQLITRQELKKMYKKEDMILCSEHILNDYYNEMFKDIKKYKVKVNKGEFHNGDIIFTDENIKKEFRHGYTTHSIQGENYKNNNIFIDTLLFKSLRMFYTAISRASYLDQLYIIDSGEDEIILNKKKVKNTKKTI